MHGAIPVPSKGQRPSAAWAAAVTDACNAVNIAGLGGTLARDGAGAFGSAPLPENKRDRKTLSRDMGCFRIVTVERDGKTVHGFGNPYVMVGGVLTRHPVDTVVEDLLAEAGESAEEDEFELFLALRILAAPPATDDPETDEDETDDNEDRVVAYADVAELAEAQRDATHHTIPLYLLSVTKTEDETSGDVSYGYETACDFRRGVWAQQWEVFT